MTKFLLTLVAFKAKPFAQLAIESILKRTKPEAFHLLVIDNGSNDATTELFKSYKGHPQITPVFNEENIGFPAAVNQGIDYFYEHKEFDYFTTAHSDIVCCSQDWNEKLLRCIKEHPEKNIKAIAGMPTNHSEGFHIYKDIYDRMQSAKGGIALCKEMNKNRLEMVFNQIYDNNVDKRVKQIEEAGKSIFHINSDNAFLSFSRELVEKVGYFDESFFPGMGEDSDYDKRLHQAGYCIYRTGSVYVHHWCSVTYFGHMDGRQVHDRAMKRLGTKNQYDQQCLKYSCESNCCGSCKQGIVVPSATVCTNYKLNPTYNKVNAKFFPTN